VLLGPLQPIGSGFEGLLPHEGTQVGGLLHSAPAGGSHQLAVLSLAQPNCHLRHDSHLHVGGAGVKIAVAPRVERLPLTPAVAVKADLPSTCPGDPADHLNAAMAILEWACS
jgi:hypothetical protein